MAKLNTIYKKAEKLVNPPLNAFQKSLINNPFLNCSYDELLNMITRDNKDNETAWSNWKKYICALTVKSADGMREITDDDVAI